MAVQCVPHGSHVLGTPWTCSVQQNANYKKAGKKMYKSYFLQKATGRMLWLGEGGGTRACAPVPSLSDRFWGLGRDFDTGAGSVAPTLPHISRQDLACARQVRAWDRWTCACLCSHAHGVWGGVKYRSFCLHLTAS